MGNALRVLSYSLDAPEGLPSFGGFLLSVKQTKNQCRYERGQYGRRYIPKEAHRRILLSEGAPVVRVAQGKLGRKAAFGEQHDAI